MRFYNQQHQFYCGVVLHARSMFTHILDAAGQTVYEKNLPAAAFFYIPKVFHNTAQG